MKNSKVRRGVRLGGAFALLIAICACGGSDSDDEPPPPAVAEPAPPPPTAPAAPAAGGTSTVSLTTGFMPDPHTATGTAGGPLAANTFDSSCGGRIPTAPQHSLTLTSDFRMLNIMVHSSGDATLVIRMPDGTYRCDDDSGGSLMPKVGGAWAAGTYQIWVGLFAGTPAPYTIGFSELESVTATSLPLP